MRGRLEAPSVGAPEAAMSGRSTQHREAERFSAPTELNQRRFEALRAYFFDGLSCAEAGQRFGYTRWAMV
jgi:predicted DNA-binding protein (UPF0251 family)